MWRYTANSLDAGYPKDLSVVFPGFPDSIQRVRGAMEISGNGQTFFLTGGCEIRFELLIYSVWLHCR